MAARWRLEQVLGIGGMAAVYRGRHQDGGQAAIKILHSNLAHLDEVRQRFVREGFAANLVGHPGVVKVLDEGVTADGCAFLVMPFLEGETLEARITRGGPMQTLECLRLASKLLGVLASAHGAGVIHRDIKPENIFLTIEGHVVLLDFGIAHVRGSESPGVTEVGTTMGTPAFMAPEQARGYHEQVDERTDLWALGATLFFCLTGQHVRQAVTANEELLQAMTEPAPRLSSRCPNLPDSLAAIVDRALAFERKKRFTDALSMRAAVDEALTEAEARGDRISSVSPKSWGRRAIERASASIRIQRSGNSLARFGFALSVLSAVAYLSMQSEARGVSRDPSLTTQATTTQASMSSVSAHVGTEEVVFEEEDTAALSSSLAETDERATYEREDEKRNEAALELVGWVAHPEKAPPSRVRSIARPSASTSPERLSLGEMAEEGTGGRFAYGSKKQIAEGQQSQDSKKAEVGVRGPGGEPFSTHK